MHIDDVADRAGAYDAQQFLEARAEPMVEVHHQLDTMLVGELDQRFGIDHADRHRFLHDDVAAGRHRGGRVLDPVRGRSADVHHVQPRDSGRQITNHRYVVLRRETRGGLGVRVQHPGDAYSERSQRLGMAIGDGAGSDYQRRLHRAATSRIAIFGPFVGMPRG